MIWLLIDLLFIENYSLFSEKAIHKDSKQEIIGKIRRINLMMIKHQVMMIEKAINLLLIRMNQNSKTVF